MSTLLITGPSGSGKSSLIAACGQLQRGQVLHVVDPLQSQPWMHVMWSPPRRDCDVVVFDHLWELPSAARQVGMAHAWCREHGKDLWLAESHREDLIRLSIAVDLDAVELQLDRRTPSGYAIAQCAQFRRRLPPHLLAIAGSIAAAPSSALAAC